MTSPHEHYHSTEMRLIDARKLQPPDELWEGLSVS
jgi:hypothetical protein